jgi:acyl-CoA synthetase (AMP-forming)/AMP-acid ligase II
LTGIKALCRQRGMLPQCLALVRNLGRDEGRDGNSAETKHAFRDGYFRTGDVGYRNANGYFYVLDRLKDMIVTGGECTNIWRFVKQQSLAACVARKPGKALSADELIAYCHRSLANYKVSRRVELSDTELRKSGSILSLPQLQNRLRVRHQWVWSYFTGQRSSRLILEPPLTPGTEAR